MNKTSHHSHGEGFTGGGLTSFHPPQTQKSHLFLSSPVTIFQKRKGGINK